MKTEILTTQSKLKSKRSYFKASSSNWKTTWPYKFFDINTYF